jgi:hypothetical protein
MTASPDTFIPLVTTSSGKVKGEEFRVLVAQSPEKARSLLEVNPAAVVSPAQRPQAETCEPRVTVQRDGECIAGIQIHCSCGQVIDLKCAYSDAPSPSPG